MFILRILVNIFSYAAWPIADKLVKKGGQLIAPLDGFFAQRAESPLNEGELERASDGIHQILDLIVGIRSFPIDNNSLEFGNKRIYI